MTLELYHGDCLEIMKTLPDHSIDLFLCDLPFGILSTKSPRRPDTGGALGGCPWDVRIDLEEFWKQVKRLAKSDHSAVLHFCSTLYGNELINSNPKWFRYDLVWNKDRGVSFLLANKLPMKSHEMIYVFSKSGAYYNRIDEKGKFKAWEAHDQSASTRVVPVHGGRNVAKANDGTTRCVKSVITMRKPNTIGHPTEKPIDLYKWLIERYCPPGGKILDPTAGSGNSGFAAYELDRECILIEKNEKFHKKILEKMERL